jgi:NADH:quinone reductase (non-electrogenic)
MTSIHHIVIVGGGAGGLELATQLGNTLGRRALARISLIDSNRTHIWKPRLHEVATGALNATVDELSYAAHAHDHHVEFILGAMKGLDRANKQIMLAPLIINDEELLPQRCVSYDTLVIAVGSQTNDFGTKGAKDHCIFLDKREAAEQLHQSLLSVYLKASQTESDGEQEFNVAIVGGGATGVELAAELTHSTQQLTHYGFRGIKQQQVTISIIEAADRLMPVLSPSASKAIAKQLQQLNVKVLTQELVTEVSSGGLRTRSGKFIPATLMVWSAGVRAPAFLQQLDGLETNKINQLVVKSTLQTTLDEDIFALGDCAQCPVDPSGQAVPPRAQTAHQQSNVLAKSLTNRLRNKPLVDFIYKDRGSLISLGKSSTIGNIMGNLSRDFTFEGKVARLFYTLLYRLHQRALHGTVKMLLLILRDKINKRTGPSLKLH